MHNNSHISLPHGIVNRKFTKRRKNYKKAIVLQAVNLSVVQKIMELFVLLIFMLSWGHLVAFGLCFVFW